MRSAKLRAASLIPCALAGSLRVRLSAHLKPAFGARQTGAILQCRRPHLPFSNERHRLDAMSSASEKLPIFSLTLVQAVC